MGIGKYHVLFFLLSCNDKFLFVLADIKAKVIFEYNALEEDELTMAVGDIVKIIDQSDEGWWEGELNGKCGMFPENFVEIIDEEPINSKFFQFVFKAIYSDNFQQYLL